jgi:hypothetical protein
MTLEAALQRVGDEFDVIAADALADSEAVLRHRGATDEEVEIELSRLRADTEAARAEVLASVVAAWHTGVPWTH